MKFLNNRKCFIDSMFFYGIIQVNTLIMKFTTMYLHSCYTAVLNILIYLSDVEFDFIHFFSYDPHTVHPRTAEDGDDPTEIPN